MSPSPVGKKKPNNRLVGQTGLASESCVEMNALSPGIGPRMSSPSQRPLGNSRPTIV